MSKSASRKNAESTRAINRSSPTAADRQNSLGTHVCVQRDATALGVQPHAPALVREVLNSPGQQLDAETRSFMEPRFGYDFSGVRVHTDEKAAESAKAVNARAYTAGAHVAFDTGRYAPTLTNGQQLIAHELTHVIQQSSGPVASTPVAEGFSVSHSGDRFEEEARRSSIAAGPEHSSENRRSLATLPTRSSAFPTSIQRADTDLSAGESHTAFAFGLGGAVGGLMSGITGIVSAYEAKRQADIAEAGLGVSKDALKVSKDQLEEAKTQNVIGREALATSEAQTTAVEGLTVTHASVPDFHPDGKGPKRDILIPLVQLGVASDDLAQYRLRLQIDNKNQVRGGGTEEEDANGYVGGFGASNASISFSATQEGTSPDAVLIQFRGTNVAGKRQGVQRIHGEVKVSAPKWEREAQPLVSHPSDRNTQQAKGPWAKIPPYIPPTSPSLPATPTPPKSQGHAQSKGKKSEKK
jgi:Domain of unknown function (DUF4157)